MNRYIGRLALASLVGTVGVAGGAWASAWARASRAEPLPVHVGTAVLRASEPVAPGPALGAGQGAPALVMLWGDSLAWQAKAAFTFMVGHGEYANVEVHAFPGTATCDWLTDMQHTVAATNVTAAVLEFSGNALTPCIKTSEYLPKYRADTAQAVAILRQAGVATYLVAGPPHRGEQPDSPGAQIRAMYREVAAQTGATYVDAGAAVLDNGRFTETLACLPGEGPALGCRGGVIQVRAADGAHFCPDVIYPPGNPGGACAVWSSGAFRFGAAMANPVVTLLRSKGYTVAAP